MKSRKHTRDCVMGTTDAHETIFVGKHIPSGGSPLCRVTGLITSSLCLTIDDVIGYVLVKLF